MTTPESPPLAPRQSEPSKPRGGRRPRLILGIALGVVLAAIAGWAIFLLPKGAKPAGPKATSSPTTAASTTPAPTSDPQASDDVEVAFRAIYAKRTRAIVERRPELIDEIYRPDCNCYELKSTVEKALRRRGHHVGYDPQVTLVQEIKEGVKGPNLITVRVVTQQGPYTVVDDNTGKVILSDPGWAPQSSAWELRRSGPGSPWTVSFLLVEGPANKVLGPGWSQPAQ